MPTANLQHTHRYHDKWPKLLEEICNSHKRGRQCRGGDDWGCNAPSRPKSWMREQHLRSSRAARDHNCVIYNHVSHNHHHQKRNNRFVLPWMSKVASRMRHKVAFCACSVGKFVTQTTTVQSSTQIPTNEHHITRKPHLHAQVDARRSNACTHLPPTAAASTKKLRGAQSNVAAAVAAAASASAAAVAANTTRASKT